MCNSMITEQDIEEIEKVVKQQMIAIYAGDAGRWVTLALRRVIML